MIKKVLLLVVLVLVFKTNAQEGSTSSPYSFYGVGLQQFKGTVENRAMGGMGLYSDSLHLNLSNPAQLGKLRFVTFTVGANHNDVALKEVGLESKATNTTFDYIALGFPISKKAAFSFGLMPWTSVGYDINTSEEGLLNSFNGRGGLNRVFLSGGYEFTKGLTAGISATYNFGNIQNETLRTQEDVELGTLETNRSDLGGFVWEFGAQYETMVTDKLELRTSLKYIPSSRISSENVRQISSVLFNDLGLVQELDTVDGNVADSDFDFPSSTTIGLGLGAPKKWFFGAEYTTIQTSNFTNRSFSIDQARFEDGSSLNVGGFYIPNYNSISSYFERITYRAGFRYEDTGLVVSNQNINEFGISFGVGLPARRNISNLNLTFEYGQRGTTDANLVQENFFNFGLSLSLNDIWFRKRKFN
jgi:hypothetical protein